MKNLEERKIKKIILKTLAQSGICVKRVILFGSRAKGNFNKYSDYDLLIATEKTFSVREKMEISRKLRIALAEFAVDIIIKSEDEVKVQKDLIGTIVREALKEGVPI
jgi:predicted nucleotidyltransferase